MSNTPQNVKNSKPHEPFILPEERVLNVQLKDVFADLDWNSRSRAGVLSDAGDSIRDTTQPTLKVEGVGFAGLMENIHETGQETPVILREVEGGKTLGGKKTTCKYELVAGFRRHAAVEKLNGPDRISGEDDAKFKERKERGFAVRGIPDGTLRAVVRKLTPVQARVVNGKENTYRNSLTTQDTVMLVKTLMGMGLNPTQIEKELGISQSYTSKLCAIALLPTAVIEHWREGKCDTKAGIPDNLPAMRVTLTSMYALAQVSKDAKAGEITDRYVRIVQPPTEPTPGQGTKPAKDKVLDKVEAMAHMVGRLEALGFVTRSGAPWHAVIGAGSGWAIDAKTGDFSRMAQLGEAAEKAYKKGKGNEPLKPVTLPAQPVAQGDGPQDGDADDDEGEDDDTE